MKLCLLLLLGLVATHAEKERGRDGGKKDYGDKGKQGGEEYDGPCTAHNNSDDCGNDTDNGCFWKTKDGGGDGNVCCKALIAKCLACQQGISKEEFCENEPDTEGCDQEGGKDGTKGGNGGGRGGNKGRRRLENEEDNQRVCCRGYTLDCLSCSMNMSPEDYCRRYGEKKQDICEGYQTERGKCVGPRDWEVDPCEDVEKKECKKVVDEDGNKLCMYLKKDKKCHNKKDLTCDYFTKKKECSGMEGCVYDKKGGMCKELKCENDTKAKKCAKNPFPGGCTFIKGKKRTGGSCCVSTLLGLERCPEKK